MKRIHYLKILLLTCSSVGIVLAQTTSRVSPVSDESWLAHLHRTFDETSMGKTGRLGPATFVADQNPAALEVLSFTPVAHAVSLTGADLYRLNCRGCHGESGTGAPPEINSVINPVRAASVAAVMARMKTVGMDMSRSEASRLAQQSRALLLDRLHNGGQDMPAFPHLSQPEVQLLLGYLNELAAVPGTRPQHASLTTSPLRVGELIVKSTCHTCHGATGENPTPQQLSDGAIPPLSTLTSRTNRSAFIRKVTRGAPVVMGSPALLCRGRMPVFYYLTPDEAADVYDYLLAYPPRASATAPLTIALWQHPVSSDDPPRSTTGSLSDTSPAAPQVRSAGTENSIILPVAGLLVLLLLGGGLAFTIHEIRKLASDAKLDEKPSLEVPADLLATPAPSMQRGLVA